MERVDREKWKCNGDGVWVFKPTATDPKLKFRLDPTKDPKTIRGTAAVGALEGSVSKAAAASAHGATRGTCTRELLASLYSALESGHLPGSLAQAVKTNLPKRNGKECIVNFMSCFCSTEHKVAFGMDYSSDPS
jgi:hypothetical protein